jgi:polygalacturonase
MNSSTSATATTYLIICFVFLHRFVEGYPQQLGTCNVLDYGAKGDGHTLDTKAIQDAIADCDSVLLPAKHTFLSAPFNLTSDQIFIINGILLATTDPSLWPVVAPLPS